MTITRGCGRRVKGGLYVEVGGEKGLPITTVLCDPPKPVDPAALGLTPRGVKLIEFDGTAMIFDWIGADSYPNAADFAEETIRYGASRRIPRNFPVGRLTVKSRLLAVHARAIVTPKSEKSLPLDPYLCPTGKHEANDPTCAGRWWSSLDPSTTEGLTPFGSGESAVCTGRTDGLTWVGGWEPGPNARVRRMPEFSYVASVYEPHEYDFAPGVIAILPITRLALINDPDDPKGTAETLGALRGSAGLPIALEDE